MEALKDQSILWYYTKQVPSCDRILQSDALALRYVGLKVTALKSANEVVIKEGAKRKGSTRPPFVSKGKKKVENMVETDESDNKSPEQLPLKMMR